MNKELAIARKDWRNLQLAMRYAKFEESKHPRGSDGKFAIQSGHYVPAGEDVDVAGEKFKSGSWIHSHQLSASEPTEQRNRYDRLKALISEGNPYGGTEDIAKTDGKDWWRRKSEESDEDTDADDEE